MILAGLDIGTNTFRLLVARMSPAGRLEELHSVQKIVRLGEGMVANGYLQPKPMKRAIATLKDFHTALKRYPVDQVVAVATSAVREAANGSEFVKAVQVETGIPVEIISAEEEASRTLVGVLSGLHEIPQTFLVLDIGGGSTEFMWGDIEGHRGTLSTDLGVVRLTERFLCASMSGEGLNALRSFIQGRLERVRDTLHRARPGGFRPVRFVGTAGTITTLAAIDLGLRVYDPQRIHQHCLNVKTVQQILEELSSRTPSERLSIPGLEKGREDLIIPGSLVLLLTMQTLDLPEVVVSEYGLREGILVDYYRRLTDEHP